MIKSILVGSAMVVALVTPAVAADFHAVSMLSVSSVQDTVLASTEGGSTCSVPGASADLGNLGGVALCSGVGSQANGGAFHAVTNNNPVTGANFLQVIGGPIGVP